MSHRHTSGPLKQTNKKHKVRDGKSKRSVKLAFGGKVEHKKGKSNDVATNMKTQSKQNRQQQILQNKKQKRFEMLSQKRLGSTSGPPRVVVMIPLTDAANTDEFLQSIQAHATSSYKQNDESSVTQVLFTHLKSKITFLQPKSRDMMDCLDICQVADIILFVSREGMVVGELIDKVGFDLLSSLKAVGMPEVVFAMQSDPIIPEANLPENKANLLKYVQHDYGTESKVFDNLLPATLQLLCRHITSCALRPIHWRNNRSYLISDTISSKQDDKDATKYQVSVTGYVRGKPLLINSLLHLVGCGTYRISSVQHTSDTAYPSNRHHNRSQDVDMTNNIIYANASQQDSLIIEASPDTIMGEQTWPTEEEMNAGTDAEDKVGSKRDKHAKDEKRKVLKDIKLPKGMSSYQADWLVNDEGDWQEDEDSSEDADDNDAEVDDDDDDDDNNGEAEEDDDNDDMHDDKDDDMDGGSYVNNTQPRPNIKTSITTSNKQDKKMIAKRAQEDLDFPDEIDTPTDLSARDRFARYRALQSFRSSPWHPKENLPLHYNRIFQFENFSGTQKRVLEEGAMAERRQLQERIQAIKSKKHDLKSQKSSSSTGMSMDDDMSITDGMSIIDEDHNSHHQSGYVNSGQYIIITIEVSSIEAVHHIEAHHRSNGGCNHAFSLLRHENKLSVLHFNIQRTDNYDDIIKAKDELLFCVGYRKYWTKPIYSESNLNCDKHKFDRYLRHGKFTVATCVGPISYSPSPLMVYKRMDDGSLVLVATGSLQSVNPDRIILKKVILTGYPIRVRNKSAVIKHMFYNPEDVLWFKPAELVTKHGLRGHITETVGTHGLYKSQFNAPITQNDTVMLILYKRIFPKFPSDGLIVN